MKHHKNKISVLSFAAVLLMGTALQTSTSDAAGFYIQEQSVSGLGSAFSGSTTTINDASTMYFNPAGLTRVQGTQFQAAAHILAPSIDFKNTGSTSLAVFGSQPIDGGNGGDPTEPTPVPNGFSSYQINDKYWVGIGVTAPFGLGSEYDSDWFGRYDSIKSNLKTIDIQPTAAMKISDKLSIGGGINIQYAEAELTNAVNGGATEGISTLQGDDWTAGYTLGLDYKPWDHTTIGLSYRSAISHKLEGSLGVENSGNADFFVKGTADLDLPNIATLGVAHDLDDKWTLSGQVTHFGWSKFEDITAITAEDFTVLGVTRNEGDEVLSVKQGYNNTFAYAAGAEYQANDAWTLRGGLQYDETPTTDEFRSSRTPDGDRTWVSVGATYDWSDAFSIDMAATYIQISEEKINVTRNNAFSDAVATTVQAETENGNVAIFALGLNYKF